MLADARTVPDGECVRCDVCIVGAGPVGITLARELSSANLEVVLLERGPSERTGNPSDPGTIVNTGLHYSISGTRALGLGGSIQEWLVDTPLGGGMGRLREMDEEDFERRDWIPHSGWPFSKEEIRPYYQPARALFDPSDAGTRSDDEWDERLSARWFEGSDQLRARLFTFGNPAVFVSEHRRQLENRESVLALTNAVVAAIESEGQHASAVRVVTEDASFTVVARTYVLAAGALETARILLCSRTSGDHALGNEHDLVGRYFMEHPHYTSGLLFPHDERLYTEVDQHAIYLREGIAVQKKYGLDERIVRQEGLPRSVVMLHPTARSARLGLLRYGDFGTRSIQRSLDLRDRLRDEGASLSVAREAFRTVPSAPYVLRFGAHKAIERAGQRAGWSRYLRPYAFKLSAMSEQIPNPLSRLSLTTRRDAFGVPVAALDWRLSDQDIDGLWRSQELLGRAIEDMVDGHVESLLDRRSLLPGLIGGAHHMGTTRMHDSPRKGVVDRDGRIHNVANVYVAGGAVFPTVGYANPTLTMLALTLRLADHLRRHLS